MAKGLILLTVAVMLDGFQALIVLSFMGVVGLTGGLVALIPIVGTVAGGATSVGGALLGNALGIMLSFMFGSFLIMLLLLNGVLSWKALVWGTPVELLLPFLPGWTAIVAGSLYNTYQRDKVRESTEHEALA